MVDSHPLWFAGAFFAHRLKHFGEHSNNLCIGWEPLEGTRGYQRSTLNYQLPARLLHIRIRRGAAVREPERPLDAAEDMRPGTAC